mmetsp:Transcript_19825/g.56035  ORF Transcript_19825/g.56035 Transcript_19825/m.56035 type:complete len:254 (+) Transcript_19825:123-884(+)
MFPQSMMITPTRQEQEQRQRMMLQRSSSIGISGGDVPHHVDAEVPPPPPLFVVVPVSEGRHTTGSMPQMPLLPRPPRRRGNMVRNHEDGKAHPASPPRLMPRKRRWPQSAASPCGDDDAIIMKQVFDGLCIPELPELDKPRCGKSPSSNDGTTPRPSTSHFFLDDQHDDDDTTIPHFRLQMRRTVHNVTPLQRPRISYGTTECPFILKPTVQSSRTKNEDHCSFFKPIRHEEEEDEEYDQYDADTIIGIDIGL